MELEGKVILVKNTSKTLSPILRTLVNFQANKLAYRKSGYTPATDEQIAAILEFNNVDPSTYSNPLKEIKDSPTPTRSKKKKEKKVVETLEESKVIETEQIEETDKED